MTSKQVDLLNVSWMQLIVPIEVSKKYSLSTKNKVRSKKLNNFKTQKNPYQVKNENIYNKVDQYPTCEEFKLELFIQYFCRIFFYNFNFSQGCFLLTDNIRNPFIFLRAERVRKGS